MTFTAGDLDEWVTYRGDEDAEDYTGEVEPGWSGLSEELYWWKGSKRPQPEIVSPFGVIRKEDDFGGMDQGSEYWIVVSVEAPDGSKRYFRKNGWYQSHYGSELDGSLDEVVEGEKVVKVWNTVN